MLGLFKKKVETREGDPELFAEGGIAKLAAIDDYRAAAPFPHLVIDDLFNPAALRKVLHEWPALDASNSESHNDGTFVRKKTGTTWKADFGRSTKHYFAELAGPHFLKTLEKVTGMWGLMGDPYMFGGGLHATGVGGKLAIHADYNKHPFFKLDRRLNLLIYLNEGWTEENAGWLELWEQDMSSCAKRVLPAFNRTVIFSTTKTSFHGQPEPVLGPAGVSRKSIALYYFSNGRADEGFPPDESESHSTLWQERPDSGY
jgi:Rps23 Pro-64 3,4-dihydroxylase Tpa1-like proline 4-hydroxylase